MKYKDFAMTLRKTQFIIFLRKTSGCDVDTVEVFGRYKRDSILQPSQCPAIIRDGGSEDHIAAHNSLGTASSPRVQTQVLQRKDQHHRDDQLPDGDETRQRTQVCL